MKLSEELRKKIRRRAERAWGESMTHSVHRITEITEKTLMYRISGQLVGAGLRNGPKIKIRRDKLGRIYVPKEV